MKKNDEIYLTKKQFYLGLIGFIFSVIFSIYSIYISSEANFFAREANNMSLMTLSHQRIIEEADLQIGTPQSANFYVDGKYLNESSIRISLVNGYYSRYPTLIVSIQGILNGKKIDLKDVPIIKLKPFKILRILGLLIRISLHTLKSSSLIILISIYLKMIHFTQ